MHLLLLTLFELKSKQLLFNACLVIVMGVFVYLIMLILCLVETLELFSSDVNNEVYHLKP